MRTTKWKVGLIALAVAGATVATNVAMADSPRWAGQGYGRYGDNGNHNGRYARDSRNSSTDYARVIHVEPLTRRVRVSEPHRDCRVETVYDRGNYYRTNDGYYANGRGGDVRATNGAIIGGLIGGAIGNQVGRGDGRRIATVAGALIGAAVGHESARNRNGDRYSDRYDDRNDDRYEDRGREVERCRVRYQDSYQERIDGYRVTYEYNGREYTTRLPYDPGQRVRVRVDVFPDEG